ncbi:hypothetical protein AAMO2058_000705900 [Amorphochlora amoebiformis]
MGNCCACLFAVSKYEKVPVDGVTEGKSTNLELVTTNDPSTTRKERGTSTTIRDLPDSKRTRRPKKQLKPAPRLAMPLEDVALQHKELREKLRAFFLIHNPSQASKKSLDHIVAFYTSFDTEVSLNKRLRDKYGKDLTSVDTKTKTRKSTSNGYKPPAPPSEEDTVKTQTSSTEVTKETLEEIKGHSEQTVDEPVETTERNRASSAIQRAAMFEQTWRSDIPTKSYILVPKSQGFKTIDALNRALAMMQATLVASGEFDGQFKAYFYMLGEINKRHITLVELVCTRDAATGTTTKYELLCKYNDKEYYICLTCVFIMYTY